MNRVLADPIGRVKLIVYCEDIDREYPTAIITSEEKYSDEQEYTDRVYLGYRDEDLLEISEPEIHEIRNLYLIQRIGSLGPDMYDKLSCSQREAFAKRSKGYHWLSEEDIPVLVKHIKSCNDMKLLYFHDSNNDLTERYGMSDSDLLELFHSLESKDVDVANSQLNFDEFDYGDQIIVFKKAEITLSCGINLGNLKFSLKLDYSEDKDSTIVFVSISDDDTKK